MSWYLDGSDVGLTASGETIDAIGSDPVTGDLVISTIGNHDVPASSGTVTGNNRDLVRFDGTAFGSTTVGTWSSFLSGTSVGLNDTSEDVSGVWLDPSGGDTFVNTIGSYSAGGLSGGLADIFAPATTHLIYDGITGDRITIDADAAGYGWFVDPSPMRDNEFRELSEHELEAKRGNVARKMDLLTVVLHEMDHVLGFDHHDEHGVMAETLGTGTRRLFDQDLAEDFGGGDESAGLATALPQSAVDKIMADDDEELEAAMLF